MSYADYLGLNEASLRELEDAAAQRGASANEQASSALGKSYQEAQRDVEAGGQGNITGTASYGDFLKAQREAAQANAPMGDGYEGAARAAMAQGRAQPAWSTQRNAMQGRVDQRRSDIVAGKANAAALGRPQQRDGAQAKAFEQAKAAYGGRLADESRGLTYFGSQQSSPSSDANTMSRAQARYGAVGAARVANKQQQANFRKLG
jgi:hypothetical protein